MSILARVRILLLLVVLLTASIFLSSPAYGLAAGILRIGGSGAPTVGITPLALAFEKARGIKVQIVPTLGSNGGIRALQASALDVALSGRALSEDERKSGLVELAYARTPLVFATQKMNVSHITKRELILIYRWVKQTWPDGTQIRLVLRPESDSDTRAILATWPDMHQAFQETFARPGMIVASSDLDAAAIIEEVPGSLGTVTLAILKAAPRAVRILSLDGVAPSPKAVAQGSYPLAKTFYMMTSTDPPKTVQEFITFVRSIWGRKVLSQSGHLVPGISPSP